MKRPKSYSTIVVVLVAILLPYGIAWLAAGRDQVFIGFLTNPGDGASYLAKMYQGWSGSWKFYLPFTIEPGEGSYLFLYYLFLGHVARWLGLSLILTFHIARIAGAGLLLAALTEFYGLVFAGRNDLYRIAFGLTALGSGMGWLVLLTGYLPSDFWVAEAYPFLSMFSNPHFPLGLALLVSSFSLLLMETARWRSARLVLNGLLISIILPFALVIALLVAGAWFLWTAVVKRKVTWQPVVSLGSLGGPFLIYQFWIAQTHPALAIWNAQNLTPSPPVWDFLLSFSPAILLVPFGIRALIKREQTACMAVLYAWFGLSLILVYFPFSLQRRFMLGFYIPVTALAVFGLDDLRSRFTRSSGWLVPAIWTLSLPTNLLLIFMSLSGALGHSPSLYFSQDEFQAFAWIRAETPDRAIILASPEMGSWIPAETGRRVLYGHPYETVNASQEKAEVIGFFQGNRLVGLNDPLFTSVGVDYLIYGPRERVLGSNLDLSALPIVFDSASVRIYQIRGVR